MKNYTYVLAKNTVLAFLVMFAWSGAVAKTVNLAPLLPADAPTQVAFQTNGNGIDGRIQWVYPSTSLLDDPASAEFVVEQSVNAGAWVSAGANVPFNSGTDYTLPLTGMVDGSTYKFRVKVISSTEESPWAESVDYPYSELTGSTTISELNKTPNAIVIGIVDGVSGEDGYRIYIKKAGDAAYQLNRTLSLGSPEQSVTISGLDPNTFYKIYVTAYKGDNSKISNNITVKTNRALPPTPNSFTFSNLCPEKVTINFSFDDISQFDEWELRMNGNIVGFGTPDATSYPIAGLSPGVNYNFVITTKNETGIRNSSVLAVRTPAYMAPDGPMNITDPYDITTNSMTVAWLNGQEDLACLNKIRDEINLFVHIEKRDGTVEDRIYFTFKDATSFTIPDLPMKAKVTITLSALNNTHNLRGYGERQVIGTTLGPPITPVDLGATPQTNHLGDEEILVTWNEYADDEEGSIVEVKVGDGEYKVIGKINANIAIFTYKPVQEGVTYTFRVKAFNEYGESNYSEEATATPEYSTEPNAPYNLNVVLNGTTAVLTWLDDANNESGFEVWRSETLGTAGDKIGEVGRNVTTFSDDAISMGMTYYYSVKSVNSVGSSDAVTTKFTYGTDAGTVGIVNVYPNPTVDLLNLRVDNAKAATVSIVNQSNRRVLSKSVDFENGEVSLDISNFTPGAYQVVIMTGDKKISRKIFKY
ncbi:fibronectin type III domain-containing protein [uncultured Arcticibacterium sp.]|uniref:fibronectin type III domain-containing protein n=1 Tax=uncultured Arcticibacterium sp. TaxID=2173042 RepID=UPI0030FCBDFB